MKNDEMRRLKGEKEVHAKGKPYFFQKLLKVCVGNQEHIADSG